MNADTPLTGSVAVLHDMAEEGWPSMDQMGHLLTTRVPAMAPGLTVTPIRHQMTRARLARTARTGAPAVLRRSRRQPDGALPAAGAAGGQRPLRSLPRRRSQLRPAGAGAARGPHHRQLSRHRHVPQPGGAGPGSARSAVQRDDEADPRRACGGRRSSCASARRRTTISCGSGSSIRRGCGSFPTGSIPRCWSRRPTRRGPAPPSCCRRSEGVFDVLHVGNDIPRKRLDRLVDVVVTLQEARALDSPGPGRLAARGDAPAHG